MKNSNLLFLFLINLFFSNYTQAAVFQAINHGDWGEPTTWDQGSVPGSSDDVVIDGYMITIDIGTGDVAVNSITVANSTGSNSELTIDGLVTITVNDDLVANLANHSNHVVVEILNGAIVNIGGNVDFIRSASNNVKEMLKLTISQASRMNVSGDFTFDYKNADSAEESNEIDLKDDAVLDVTGNTYLYMTGGKNFKFDIGGSSKANLRGDVIAEITGGTEMVIHNHSHLVIGGNFIMNSEGADKVIKLELVNAGSVTEIMGDISMSAVSEGDVFITHQ